MEEGLTSNEEELIDSAYKRRIIHVSDEPLRSVHNLNS
jgi:hypothetical protein